MPNVKSTERTQESRYKSGLAYTPTFDVQSYKNGMSEGFEEKGNIYERGDPKSNQFIEIDRALQIKEDIRVCLLVVEKILLPDLCLIFFSR